MGRELPRRNRATPWCKISGAEIDELMRISRVVSKRKNKNAISEFESSPGSHPVRDLENFLPICQKCPLIAGFRHLVKVSDRPIVELSRTKFPKVSRYYNENSHFPETRSRDRRIKPLRVPASSKLDPCAVFSDETPVLLPDARRVKWVCRSGS
jgi:hypothetical protein